MKVSDIFDVLIGHNLNLNQQTKDDNGINFVSCGSVNNGVLCKIKLENNMHIYKQGDITVALCGSVLSCFVQNKDFVISQNVAVLRPKNTNMSILKKLFYCYALNMNKYKFLAFGRSVNKHIKNIELPDYIPNWIYTIQNIDIANTNNINNKTLIDYSTWKEFKCSDLFNIKRGEIKNLNNIDIGYTPVVSASNINQGIQYYLDVEAKYSNTLTVTLNGYCGYCTYHRRPFNVNYDCGVLIPKFTMNKYIGLFVTTILNYCLLNKYTYNRKLSPSKLNNEIISLPVTQNNQIDFLFMENYIKSLQYGDKI